LGTLHDRVDRTNRQLMAIARTRRVPNCLPPIEALIVAVPDDVLRAYQSSGLPLNITLTNGETIAFAGIPPYVQGYLQAVDRYRG